MNKPLVSCLMLTHNKLEPFKLSLDCYNKQTYENKELIIVNSGSDEYFTSVSKILPKRKDIKHIKVKNGDLFVGDLRNISIDNASGDYLCTFDDDDIHAPNRIEFQMSYIFKYKNIHGTLLKNFNVNFLNTVYCCSFYQGLHPSLLVKRNHLKYPSLNRHEDTEYIDMLHNEFNILVIDNISNIYTYCYHNDNISGKAHFEYIINNHKRFIGG
ncbi:MAG: glycosyltransferase family A protein [bacterium]